MGAGRPGAYSGGQALADGVVQGGAPVSARHQPVCHRQCLAIVSSDDSEGLIHNSEGLDYMTGPIYISLPICVYH